MADVTMTGRFGGVLEALAVLFANTPAFRTWTGTGDVAAALPRVHFFSDLVANWTRPAVLVWDSGLVWERDAGGAVDEYSAWAKGTVTARFEQLLNPTYAGDPEQGAKDFFDNVDLVLEGMAVLAGSGTFLSVGSFAPSELRFQGIGQGESETIYFEREVAFEVGSG